MNRFFHLSSNQIENKLLLLKFFNEKNIIICQFDTLEYNIYTNYYFNINLFLIEHLYVFNFHSMTK